MKIHYVKNFSHVINYENDSLVNAILNIDVNQRLKEDTNQNTGTIPGKFGFTVSNNIDVKCNPVTPILEHIVVLLSDKISQCFTMHMIHEDTIKTFHNFNDNFKTGNVDNAGMKYQLAFYDEKLYAGMESNYENWFTHCASSICKEYSSIINAEIFITDIYIKHETGEYLFIFYLKQKDCVKDYTSKSLKQVERCLIDNGISKDDAPSLTKIIAKILNIFHVDMDEEKED